MFSLILLMCEITPVDIIKSFRRLARGLTPDQKRIRWEAYAQKTGRQEIMFKRVFASILDEQKKQIVERFKQTGKLPGDLMDENTARKFAPAIKLVYESAFTEAV